MTIQEAGKLTEEQQKVRRRQEAIKRNEERNKRTPQEQMALLDLKLGKGFGAKRERARLEKRMKNER